MRAPSARPLPVIAWLAIPLSLVGAARGQDEARVAHSVGTPRAGRIEGTGAELPARGTGYHWVTNHGNPDARYATPTLVDAVQRALAAVSAAYPGSDLAVFDFGHPSGGPIHGHASHTSGRDGDLGYFAQDLSGARVTLTGPVVLRPDGTGYDGVNHRAVRLDTERTWALMDALLRDDSIRVMRLFVFPPLRRQLLDYARARGVAAADLARAAAVLRPSGRANAPHNDHFHIRIACPTADRSSGCHD